MKLPKQCVKCDLWEIGAVGTPDYGKILCYENCPHRPIKDINRGLTKFL